MTLRRGSSGSLSLREVADEFFAQPPPEHDPSPKKLIASRRNSTGNLSAFNSEDLQSPSINSLHMSLREIYAPSEEDFMDSFSSRRSNKQLSRRSEHSFSVEDLTSFGRKNTSSSSRIRSRGSSATRSHHGSDEDFSSSLERFSAMLRHTIEEEKRHSMPSRHGKVRRSKSSDGLFDLPPPPYLYSPASKRPPKNVNIKGKSSSPKGLNFIDILDDDKSHRSEKPLKSRSRYLPKPSRRRSTGSYSQIAPEPGPTLMPKQHSRDDKGADHIDVHETQHSPSTTKDTKELFPTTSYIEKYLHHYVENLRLPDAFLTSILKAYDDIDSRLWLMENTFSMNIPDSHRAKIDTKLEYIKKIKGQSRWTELTQTVDFHVKMSARCFLPTKFWFVNDPGPSIGPQRFAVAWGALDDVKEERSIALDMMNKIVLDVDKCPWKRQLRKIEKRVREEAPRLMAANKVVTLILCTQGKPTDDDGNEDSTTRKELLDSLETLSALPTKIVVRLCTEDDCATDLLNRAESKLETVTLLNDYWGEAMDVYLHNPWLTYGLGIHRLREACLTSILVNDLGVTPFGVDEIYEFCWEFFIGEKEMHLPHPQTSLGAFMNGLNRLLEEEKLQWNPITKELTPWIDLVQLETILQCSLRKPNLTDDLGKASPTDSQNMTLTQTIQRWSHVAPDCERLNSLQELLCTIPSLFPPANKLVAQHDYFDKVPTFSKEAFSGNSGSQLKELLKRAVRKMKYFINPDKLPKDLTDSQTLLFQTIWDVIQKQEENTLQN